MLECDDAVIILGKKKGGFTRIRYAPGHEGFVESSLIREGAPPTGIPSPATPAQESENPSLPSQAASNDVVQAPFGEPIARKQAPFCQRPKHVNVFIRLRNDGTAFFDDDGNRKISAGVRYPTLAPAYIGQVERLLRNEGYCVYHAVIFENPQVMEQPSWVPNAAGPAQFPALLQLDASMALSPTEVSTELEAEPPYVLVNFHAVVGYHMEALSMTARNRWLSLVPEIVGSSLFDNGRSTASPERLITFIDWVANRIPSVKTKLMFEGRELPQGDSEL
jgi:hypothetical protein